jgi:hypothetical protein
MKIESCGRPALRRSADFQSAVSPACSRRGPGNIQGVENAGALRIENPRYSRLKICATARGLTLLEMMVSITLLLVIMIGLLLMFNQTQKALHIANAQTDVFENARGPIQMIARDLSEMSDCGDLNASNAFVTPDRLFPMPVTAFQLPNGSIVNTIFQDAFWITHVNDEWRGIRYVLDGSGCCVGTLYRVAEPVRAYDVTNLFGRVDNIVLNRTNMHRIAEGVVHFAFQAVYVTNTTGSADDPVIGFDRSDPSRPFTFPQFLSETTTNGPSPTRTVSPLPAYVDLDIGVLEPAAFKQYQALTNAPDPSVAEKFLASHVGRIHFFRERVPIRNFINPYRSNEVP